MQKKWLIVEYEGQILENDFEINYYKPGMSRSKENNVHVEVYSWHNNEAEAINEVQEHELHSEVHKTTGSFGAFYTVIEYFIQERSDEKDDTDNYESIFREYQHVIQEIGPVPLEEDSKFQNVEFNEKKYIWPKLKEQLEEIDSRIMKHIRFDCSPRSNQEYFNMFVNEYKEKYKKEFVLEQ